MLLPDTDRDTAVQVAERVRTAIGDLRVLEGDSSVSASFGIAVNRNDEDAQWVRNLTVDGQTRYVFAHLDQTTTSMTTRVNYTITPNLSLQVYAQPFVSAGVYRDYKELVRPRADWLALDRRRAWDRAPA